MAENHRKKKRQNTAILFFVRMIVICVPLAIKIKFMSANSLMVKIHSNIIRRRGKYETDV